VYRRDFLIFLFDIVLSSRRTILDLTGDTVKSFFHSIYSVMHMISNVLAKVLFGIIVSLVVINFGAVFLQVVNRYIIVKISDITFSFTDELARYSMVWVTYAALCLCLREGSMAQLDLIYDRLGKRGKIVMYLIGRILMCVFIFIVLKFGIYIMEIRKMYRTSMMNLPGPVLYAAPVVGSVLLFFEMLTELAGVFSGDLDPFTAGKKRTFPSHEEPGSEVGSVADFER